MNLPHRIGVGINYQAEIAGDIVRHLDAFDLIEVISDNLFHEDAFTPELRHVMAAKPVVLHGVNMSLGGAHELDGGYVARLRHLAEEWNPLWISDHLAFSRLPTLDVGQLMPVTRSRANLELIARKAAAVRAALPRPFLIENITAYFEYPDDEMDEPAFLRAVLARSGCGLLLDVNNLHINSHNLGFDPFAVLDRLPLERVVQIHLAGGFTREGLHIDSHGHRIVPPVWSLLERVCERASPRAIIIERDQNHDVPELLESVARAREILCAAHAPA
jgi:uncharacterized protein